MREFVFVQYFDEAGTLLWATDTPRPPVVGESIIRDRRMYAVRSVLHGNTHSQAIVLEPGAHVAPRLRD